MYDNRFVYRGECSCGWKSESEYRTRGFAFHVAEVHHRATHPSWGTSATPRQVTLDYWRTTEFAEDNEELYYY